MEKYKTELESILFDYTTTYKTSYRGTQPKRLPPIPHREKPEPPKPDLRPVKGVQTLTEWKNPLPFNMLHRPRPIINTDPRAVQQKYEKPIDELKSQIQKTRPRLVLTPAVSMDDIEDPRAREILIEDMYTSDMSRSLREAVTEYSRVEAPSSSLPAPANPIALPKLQPPVVPREWRMESVSWDGKQLRSNCNQTEVFWLKRDLHECTACKESNVVAESRRMLRKLKIAR